MDNSSPLALARTTAVARALMVPMALTITRRSWRCTTPTDTGWAAPAPLNRPGARAAPADAAAGACCFHHQAPAAAAASNTNDTNHHRTRPCWRTADQEDMKKGAGMEKSVARRAGAMR